MSSEPLERVQHDLQAIKSALAADFPYDRGSLRLSLLAALCGVPFALRTVPGWDRVMTVILLVLIAGLAVVSGGWWRRAYTQRGSRPRRWSWGRQEAASGIVAILGLLAYVLITRWVAVADEGWNFAVWRARLAAPVLFAFGIGMLSLAVAVSERRVYLGWGLALATLGLATPWIPSRAAFMAVCGVSMLLGGLVSSAILWRQLRQWEALHGHD